MIELSRLVPSIALVLLSFSLLPGCEKKDDKRPPEVARNTEHLAYATEYPDRVERVTTDLDDRKARAEELCGQLEEYAEQLEDPADYDKVKSVYVAAESSGKSGNYAERARQNREFSRMMEENDGEIGKTTMASVHGAARHDKCPHPGNVAGAAKNGMKKGVDKRTEARLREANEAHRVIARNKEALGKKNVPTLETQADEIAEASYIANVELPLLKHELERLIGENEAVTRTIAREIKDEEKLQNKDGASDADKKASEARVKKLEETQSKLEEQKEMLKERKEKLKELDKEIKRVRQDCDKAHKSLKKKVKAKGKASEKEGDA